MSHKVFVFLTSAIFVFCFSWSAVAADDGSKIFVDSCSGCHTAKVRPLDNLHLTRDQWKEAVERMIDQGAEVPKGRMQELLDYLVKNHGPAGALPDAHK
jgi:hypothetical protein